MRLSSGSAPSRAPRAFASGARLCPARSRGYLLSRMAITLHPRSLEETVDALRTTVFGKVEETELRSIAAEAAWVGLEAGETLFPQGMVADALYLLVSGRLSVLVRADDGAERLVGTVYPGESVGEMAILSDERRSATVRARRDAVLLRLDQASFRELIPRHPGALLALNRLLIDRLRAVLQGQRRKVPERVVALIPACAGAPTRALAARLADVSRTGSLLVVDAARVREALGSPAQGSPVPAERVARWLDAQEAQHDLLLLVGDTEDEAWTRRCLRQADRVLLVGRGDAAPGNLPWSATIAQRARTRADQRHELALVHRDDAPVPTGAARWLDALGVPLHHHVRLGVDADVARLSRFLRGEAIGLALSGGAARGFAHVGVLRALEEARVPIDFVCGTSMGAIIGAKVALGWSAEEVRRAMRRGFARLGILDITLPVVSACAGREVDDHIAATFGDRPIEDLWLPFRCVSSSIIRARKIVHRRGPVRRAVLVSSALPGVFPPLVEDDDVLADGVLLDNLPVGLAVEAGCGHTIAVNVINTIDTSMARVLRAGVRPLDRLLGRLLPTDEGRPPGISDLVMRSFFLPTLRDIERIRAQIDLYIEPPVDQFHFLDPRPFEAVAQVGYESARARIDAWLESHPAIPRS